MFDKVLIANRGEVAVRVIRACRDMGIKTVAVYSTADADALHVQLADEAYCIGGPRLAESYLNDDAVLTCAVKSGAKAIHPGYGFFSEKASFVRDCDKYGLAFVGPSAKVIDSMGDKDAARRTAAAAGVPIVPGCDLLKSPEEQRPRLSALAAPCLLRRVRAAAVAVFVGSSAWKMRQRPLLKHEPRARPFLATASATWRSSSRRRITLRYRLWPISRAMCFRSASASARCSGATKS